jgi:KipI family sensor histidine kinase inhibitor
VTWRLRHCGESGVLVVLSSPEQVTAVLAAADLDRLPGVREAVPGAVTVHLDVEESTWSAARLREAITAALRDPAVPGEGSAAPAVVIPVRYDGPDLDRVAAAAGCSPLAWAQAHAAASYTVAFTGFAPGFAYLAGLPDRLCAPRLDEPRARVPAGALGVGGSWTGIYPRAMPGGWNLVGSSDAALFVAERDPPALLMPGTRVTMSRVC